MNVLFSVNGCVCVWVSLHWFHILSYWPHQTRTHAASKPPIVFNCNFITDKAFSSYIISRWCAGLDAVWLLPLTSIQYSNSAEIIIMNEWMNEWTARTFCILRSAKYSETIPMVYIRCWTIIMTVRVRVRLFRISFMLIDSLLCIKLNHPRNGCWIWSRLPSPSVHSFHSTFTSVRCTYVLRITKKGLFGQIIMETIIK